MELQRERLEKQLAFIREIDKLKQVVRRTYLLDGSRRENDAEHSWQLSVMAMVLAEYADDRQLDLFRVIRMLLIHDLVEIDAGDTFAYDEKGHLDKRERERKAAERLFGMLPDDLRRDFMDLWEEFEDRQSPEARFASAIDRVQPLLHNYYTQGKSWREHGVTKGEVLARNREVAAISDALWRLVCRLVDDAAAKGYLLP